MIDDPSSEKKENLPPDGKPSTSRRKSTEKEQRLSVGASSDPQESLIAARAILSDIVNHVVSERSPRPTEASADNGNSVLNRTLSSRSLKSYLLAGQCVPDEDCANRTFPLEADPEGSERPSPTSANAGSSSPADTGVVTEPSGSARADNALRPCTSEASAEASPCVLLSPENRSSDAHPVASRSATPVDTDQGGSASDSVSEPPSSDCWYYTDASDASLPGVGANKSELDLTYTTAKGSPLGAARFFDTSSLHTSNVAPSEDTEVNHPAGSAFNESCDQEEAFCDSQPADALELHDGHLETSGNVTCDVLRLQDSESSPESTLKLLSPGLIEKTFESPSKNFGVLAPSDLQKASTPTTQEDVVPHFDYHCSVQSPTDFCNKTCKASEASSHLETPTHTHRQDETVTLSATGFNENLLSSSDPSNAEVTVIEKDPATPAAVLGNEATAHIQCHPDKGTTEGTLPVDSEAGPEVAQFSEEEHRAAAVYFKEDLDFLQKVGSSQRLGRTSLGRCSLFLNFDPLLANSPTNAPSEESRPKNRYSLRSQLSEKGSSLADLSESEDLLNLTAPSPPHGASVFVEEQMFSEKEMSQALKYQELMFQERLLKKDQEFVRQLESARQEAESFRGKLEESQELFQIQERALQCLERHTENLVEALQLVSKDAQKESAEKEESLQNVARERDQLLEDLHCMEKTFSDFHRRYEKAKEAIRTLKQNEAILKKQLAEAGEALEKNCHMVHIIKTKTEESIEGANKEVENTKRSFEADITVLKGQLKKATMTINSLEKRLEQKNEENAELTKLYDDLLNQVKAK